MVGRSYRRNIIFKFCLWLYSENNSIWFELLLLNKLWLISRDLCRLACKMWKSELGMVNVILWYCWGRTGRRWRMCRRIINITVTICWIIATTVRAIYLCIHALLIRMTCHGAISAYWYFETHSRFMPILLTIETTFFFWTNFLLYFYINRLSSNFYNPIQVIFKSSLLSLIISFALTAIFLVTVSRIANARMRLTLIGKLNDGCILAFGKWVNILLLWTCALVSSSRMLKNTK